jgi:hypothetical protein
MEGGGRAKILHTDIGDCGRYSDFDARVALLGQLALEEFVQFSVEDTVGDKLAALGDGALRSSHDCGLCTFLLLSNSQQGACKSIELAIRGGSLRASKA